MSLENLFWYRRLDNKGKPLEIWDAFSVFNVVHGWWQSEEIFSVRLNDGHEEARDAERTIRSKGGKTGKEIVRERGWYLTQIDMCKEDASRLRAATELHSPGRWIVDNVNVPPPEGPQDINLVWD